MGVTLAWIAFGMLVFGALCMLLNWIIALTVPPRYREEVWADFIRRGREHEQQRRERGE